MNAVLKLDLEEGRTLMYGGIVNSALEDQSLADSIRKWRPKYVNFGNILVPLRQNSTDFPEVTLSHFAIDKLVSKVQIPKRESIDFPGLTGLHKGLGLTLDQLTPTNGAPVVDIGCGLGAIGTSLANKLKLDQLIMADLSEDAFAHTHRTFAINSKSQKTPDENIEYRLGDAVETLSDLDGGVGFAAPYLIPEVCVVFGGIYNVLANISKNQGMDVYIAHSNLSEHLIARAAEEVGVKMTSVFRAFESQPLHPEYAYEKNAKQLAQKKANMLFPDTVSELKKLGLKGDDGKYYHDIMISRFSR